MRSRITWRYLNWEKSPIDSHRIISCWSIMMCTLATSEPSITSTWWSFWMMCQRDSRTRILRGWIKIRTPFSAASHMILDPHSKVSSGILIWFRVRSKSSLTRNTLEFSNSFKALIPSGIMPLLVLRIDRQSNYYHVGSRRRALRLDSLEPSLEKWTITNSRLICRINSCSRISSSRISCSRGLRWGVLWSQAQGWRWVVWQVEIGIWWKYCSKVYRGRT
jgi:hypothetical protein